MFLTESCQIFCPQGSRFAVVVVLRQFYLWWLFGCEMSKRKAADGDDDQKEKRQKMGDVLSLPPKMSTPQWPCELDLKESKGPFELKNDEGVIFNASWGRAHNNVHLLLRYPQLPKRLPTAIMITDGDNVVSVEYCHHNATEVRFSFSVSPDSHERYQLFSIYASADLVVKKPCNIVHHFWKLFREQKDIDYHITASDGSKIGMHKIIFACQSDTMRTIAEQKDFGDGATYHLNVTNKTAQWFVRFLYLQEIPSSTDMSIMCAMELYKLADQHDLPGLKTGCGKLVADLLTVSSLDEGIKFCRLHRDRFVRQKIYDLVKTNPHAATTVLLDDSTTTTTTSSSSSSIL
jgi:hypothetical protein